MVEKGKIMIEPLVFVKLKRTDGNYIYIQPKNIDYFETVNKSINVYLTFSNNDTIMIDIVSDDLDALVSGIERYTNNVLQIIHAQAHTHEQPTINNNYTPKETKND